MDIELEQLRTFGILSETPQFINGGTNNRYVTYGGYLFTYSTFSTLFMWAMCGPTIYQHIWKEHGGNIDLLKTMNAHDLELQSMDNESIAYHLLNKIKKLLGPLEAEKLETIVNNMFENSRDSTTIRYF